jgi:hypothetical protein
MLLRSGHCNLAADTFSAFSSFPHLPLPPSDLPPCIFPDLPSDTLVPLLAPASPAFATRSRSVWIERISLQISVESRVESVQHPRPSVLLLWQGNNHVARGNEGKQGESGAR